MTCTDLHPWFTHSYHSLSPVDAEINQSAYDRWNKDKTKGPKDVPVFSCPSSRVQLTGTPIPNREVEDDGKRWQDQRAGEAEENGWGRRVFVSHQISRRRAQVCGSWIKMGREREGEMEEGREGQDRVGVGIGGNAARSLCVASVYMCECVCMCLGGCVLSIQVSWENWCSFLTPHLLCDLCPIPTGHPHRATDAYSLGKWHRFLKAR